MSESKAEVAKEVLELLFKSQRVDCETVWDSVYYRKFSDELVRQSTMRRLEAIRSFLNEL